MMLINNSPGLAAHSPRTSYPVSRYCYSITHRTDESFYRITCNDKAGWYIARVTSLHSIILYRYCITLYYYYHFIIYIFVLHAIVLIDSARWNKYPMPYCRNVTIYFNDKEKSMRIGIRTLLPHQFYSCKVLSYIFYQAFINFTNSLWGK